MTCDLNRTDDQRQILDAATAMLAAHYPVARLREPRTDSMAALAEFGGFLLAASEEDGGAGFTLVEEALLHVRLGHHLVSPRAVAGALACRLAARQAEPALAERIAAGAAEVCPALPHGDGHLLIDAEGAALALAFEGRRLSLIELGGTAPEPVAGLGHGGIATSRLAPGRGRRIAEGDDRACLTADLLVSAQLLGIAEAARDLAVDYAQTRRQFGKPIGAFQAIKHHCANMGLQAEMLSAQLDMAAIAARDGRDDAAFQVAALRRLAPRAALFNTRTAIQVHGGIGFSAEADIHHYLKQAHVLIRLGEPAPLLDLPAALAPRTNRPRRTPCASP
ncbi:acyl-CoA dehydrogenase [Psychromarinibacter sp. C21-152]|uniref:Acyl-CoA dehydrogenase n=1 Tax=Psychromarinibacter sediminicola TaxID=3033385 RepID=A0AAE3T7F3_9RHOB|nr:acyl-CoA dehydrogenase [Psychromarinibacter sediminicola]MDF0599603.1 acyl-CoA dehydrogenase [Psychromarinibacter sediminicola]